MSIKLNKNRMLGILFVIVAVMIITNWDIVTSLAVTLSADGTNESLYLNPTGTGSVVVGGNSLVLATKTSAPSSPSAGQIYFDTTLGQFRGYTGSDWVDLSETVPSFPTSGLVSYWKLDESYASASDEINGNTLTNNNTAAYATGKINNGVDLELSGAQYLDITDSAQSGLDITGDLSIQAWFKLESAPGTDMVMTLVSKYKGNGDQRSYRVHYRDASGTKKLGFAVSANGISATLGEYDVTLSTATWYHLVITYSAAAGTGIIYLNGSPVATPSSLNTSILNGTAHFAIGAEFDVSAQRYFDGIIDEVGIWNRVLTAEEVTTLYNDGEGFAY